MDAKFSKTKGFIINVNMITKDIIKFKMFKYFWYKSETS